jgi:hypothetical protein
MTPPFGLRRIAATSSARGTSDPPRDEEVELVELSDDERDLLLSALSELSRTRREDDVKQEQAKALILKLGGDPEAVSFDAGVPDRAMVDLEDVPGLDDGPDGVYYPHAGDGDDDVLAEQMLLRLLADCVTNGQHHLATLDHPQEGMVFGCTHCHRYWRTRA